MVPRARTGDSSQHPLPPTPHPPPPPALPDTHAGQELGDLKLTICLGRLRLYVTGHVWDSDGLSRL